MSFPNMYHGDTHPHHEAVYTHKKKENFTHEIIAAAAGFEAMRLLENHMTKVNGKPVGSNHHIFRELLAGFAAAEIDKIIEEHMIQDQYDVEKIKADARSHALKHYNESYGKDPIGFTALGDFHYQYSLYGEYHTDKNNQLVHTLFVPALLWSAFAIASCLAPAFAPWPLDEFGIPLNLTFIVASAYAIYYIVLHPIIGGTGSLLVLGNLVAADLFARHGLQVLGVDPLIAAVAVHVLSWAIQVVVGHQIYEKRAAAFLDHPLQGLCVVVSLEILTITSAIVLAPLFVWAHLLVDIGLFPELKLQLQATTDARVAIYKASLAKKEE
ncbi:UNVERIFIED_CONTAM: hypothetical protein HDU68_003878 [Siphonaria sp. JEL0065]|nr:hypothetical protein HDU68_003878 [Siphonaria sp. JEL0065]